MTESTRLDHKPKPINDLDDTRLLDSYCPPQEQPHPLSFLALANRIDAYCEMISEHEAEMGSEIAMFGDAWPGAQPQLRAKKEACQALLDEWNNPLELPALPDVLLPHAQNQIIAQLESAFDVCITMMNESASKNPNYHLVEIAQALETAARELSHDLREHVLAEENYHTPTDEAGEAQRRANLDLLLAGGQQW